MNLSLFLQRICLFSFVFLVCFSSFAGQVVHEKIFQTQKEMELIEKLRKQISFSGGVSIALSKRGKGFSTSFGYADVAHQKKATLKTRYRMASVTKSFTAVAVLQLVENGKIRLDDEVQRYVPLFPKKRWPVTIADLLGHLGGISHYKNLPGERNIQTHMTTRQSLALFEQWPLLQKPGEKYVYSSYGYNLLGAVLEGATKKSYAQVLKAQIFLPLKMMSTSMDGGKKRLPHQPIGYKMNTKGELYRSPFVDVSSRFAGGGTRSTVEDMLRFGQGLLRDQLVAKKIRQKMFSSMTTTEGRYTDYGMGFATYPLGGRWIVAHAGAQPETSTLLLMVPTEDLVIALACNVEDQWRLLQTFSRILIAEVLDDGKMRRGLVAEDGISQIQLTALNKIFSHGLAFYTRFGEPLGQKDSERVHAFSELKDKLLRANISMDLPSSVLEVQLGHEPMANRVYTRVGSFMASVIEKYTSKENLHSFHFKGPLAFFSAYAAACVAFDCPLAYRFERLNGEIEPMVRVEQKAREKYDAHFVLAPNDTFDEVKQALNGLYGYSVKPDFSAALGSRALMLALANQGKEAARFDDLNANLYQNAPPRLWTSLQVGCLLDAPLSTRKYEEVDLSDGTLGAFELLLKSVQRDQYLSTGRIRFAALTFRKRGFYYASLLLLHLAAEAFPDDLSLQDTACKESLRRKSKKTALMFCKKAFEISSTSKRKKRLKKAEKF